MSKEILNKIVVKFERLDEYLVYLKDIQKVNKRDFLRDFHFFGLAERYLQLSIEVLVDVGKLLVIEKGLRKPEDNQDIFAVLYEARIISEKLVTKLAGIVSFRNVLVHEYDKIDRKIVYQKLKENLDNLKDFKKAVLRYLRNKI